MRGHVYYFTKFVPDDPAKAGSLIDKFVIVLQNETEFPTDRQRIVVVVATSNLEGEGKPYNVIVETGEFPNWKKRTLIQCADLRSLLKSDLKKPDQAEYVGMLSDETMRKVDVALVASLSLGEWMG
jgi:mRNA-degrading endonuclease toxin of MazEF toxin-antitoxin module